MNVAEQILESIGWALLRLMANPFYWAGLLLVAMQYRRAIAWERRLYSVRLHSLGRETLSAFLFGTLAGLAASVPMAFVGTWITGRAMIVLLVLSLLLALARLRFFCIAYAVGLFGLLQWALQWVPVSNGTNGWQPWVDSIKQAHLPSLLLIAGLLHGAEALLVWKRGTRMALPIFVDGPRGRVIGGYQFQGFWPVPLLLWIPAQLGGGIADWSPFAGGSLWHAGWQLFALPVMLGFTDRTTTELPAAKMRQNAARLTWYAVMLGITAGLAELWPLIAVPLASILAIGGHEALFLLSRLSESGKRPRYSEDPRGIVVLAVIPGTPAEGMGILPGEIIAKVNGASVRDRQALHQALRLNPAMAKLEVLNHDGQSKFAQKAVFADDHHLLGLVLAPDEEARYVVSWEREQGLYGLLRIGAGMLWRRGAGSGKSRSGSHGEPPLSG